MQGTSHILLLSFNAQHSTVACIATNASDFSPPYQQASTHKISMPGFPMIWSGMRSSGQNAKQNNASSNALQGIPIHR